MTNNFQQTVNLKEKFKRGGDRADINKEREPKQAPVRPKRRVPLDEKSHPTGRAEEIDQVYQGAQDAHVNAKKLKHDLRNIDRPKIRRVNEPIFKRVVIVAAIILVGLTVYGLFFKGRMGNGPTTDTMKGARWYAIKLVTEEIYYGQINDTSADPVVARNVYYNYDQFKEGKVGEAETGNLKLVKRGKETHGPEGTMDIVRSQVVYMEPLKEDSKVLKAILDYER